MDKFGAEYKERPLTKVTKMQILVHRGYIKDVMTDADQEQLERSELLPAEYVDAAKNLGSAEIMLILIHNLPETFRADRTKEKLYIKTVREIKNSAANPNQILVITSRSVPFSGADKGEDLQALGQIKTIAKARGYEIEPDSKIEVFGESHDECVHEVLAGINNSSFFQPENVKILKQLTDRPK